jgi:hypothetical protein
MIINCGAASPTDQDLYCGERSERSDCLASGASDMFTRKHKESLRVINRMESVLKLKAYMDVWYKEAEKAMESNDIEKMKEIDNRFEEVNGKNAVERIERSLREIHNMMRICVDAKDVRKVTEECGDTKNNVEGKREKMRRDYQREYQRAYRLKKKEQQSKNIKNKNI